MGRFQRSERGGGQPDPQEALRRAREAVQRERERERERAEPIPRDDEEERVEEVEEALREHDEKLAEEG
jgi:hypothetical protein